MGMNKADLHDAYLKRRTMGDMDDFEWYGSATTWWTSVLAGSATIAAGDGVGGILTMSAIDSTLNREAYLKHTIQLFKFQANTPIVVEAYLQFSEANANKANIAFGLMSSVGAASMQDTTGEPKTSFSGAVVYKVPGGTQWKTASSIGTTQTVNQSDTTAGGSSYQRLKIEIMPISSTIAEVTYYVDGVQLKVAGQRPGTTKIKDQVTYTGAAAMQAFACLKNGSTTPEVLLIDYIAWEQTSRLFTGF